MPSAAENPEILQIFQHFMFQGYHSLSDYEKAIMVQYSADFVHWFREYFENYNASLNHNNREDIEDNALLRIQFSEQQ